MRASEFIKENASVGATSAGSVAVVSQPLGSVIKRVEQPETAKYANSYPTKKRKQNAGR